MHFTNSLKINFHSCSTYSLLSVLNFFFKCKFSLVTTVLSKREILLVLKTTTLLLHCKLAVFANHATEIINVALLSFLLFLLK